METPKQMMDRLAAKKESDWAEALERSYARLEMENDADSKLTEGDDLTFAKLLIYPDVKMLEQVMEPSKKREDETMEEYSKRLDRLTDAKKKCDFCKHEKGVHLLGDCGQCDCEKFVPHVFKTSPHLEQRPFQDAKLVALRNQLNAEARGTGPVPKRRDNQRVNPKAKRQR